MRLSQILSNVRYLDLMPLSGQMFMGYSAFAISGWIPNAVSVIRASLMPCVIFESLSLQVTHPAHHIDATFKELAAI